MLMSFVLYLVCLLRVRKSRKKKDTINCTKTNSSGREEYSKALGELSIRNSAKCLRTLSRRRPLLFGSIKSGTGTGYQNHSFKLRRVS